MLERIQNSRYVNPGDMKIHYSTSAAFVIGILAVCEVYHCVNLEVSRASASGRERRAEKG